MDSEVNEYLDNISKLLSGQLRGFINEKAREENLQLIQLTMVDIWEKCEEYTRVKLSDQHILDKLEEELDERRKHNT